MRVPSEHERRAAVRLLLSAVLSFCTASACAIIANHGVQNFTFGHLLVLGAFAVTGAISALTLSSLACSVSLPFVGLLVATYLLESGAPQWSLVLEVGAIIVAVARGTAPLRWYHTLLLLLFSCLLVAGLAFQQLHPWAFAILLFAAVYMLARHAILATTHMARLCRGAFAELAPALRPAVAFLVLYCSVALFFALIYGVLFYTLPGSLRSNGHDSDITILSLFQWSLTVSATAGTLELIPDRWYVRAILILHLLSNIFLVSIYLAHFLSPRIRDGSLRHHAAG